MQTTITPTEERWQRADPERFWRLIARDQHVFQTYSTDDELLCTLFTFADDGFKANDSVLIIATAEHRRHLDQKLRDAGHNLFNLRLRDQYIFLDASEMLSEFMIHGAPDPLLFQYTISDLIKRAKRSQRRVRAFGELVAIVWSSGNQDAAVALEKLWNTCMDQDPFTLYCAYPHVGTSGVSAFDSIQEAHRRCLGAHQPNENHLLFR